jgi:hypothetical protein
MGRPVEDVAAATARNAAAVFGVGADPR